MPAEGCREGSEVKSTVALTEDWVWFLVPTWWLATIDTFSSYMQANHSYTHKKKYLNL